MKKPRKRENVPSSTLTQKDFEFFTLSISPNHQKVKVNHEFEPIGAILKRRFGGTS